MAKMVFLGPPGAGKGTLAGLASKRLGLRSISTGDIFRAAVKDETELGKRVKGILASGALVPDELTISLVKERLGLPDVAAGYILDGFPRTIPQADALQGFSPVDVVVNFEVKDSVIIFRLSGRRVCRACGRIYHIATMPPKKEGICDSCGGELYTRPDDAEDAIATRLKAYRAQTFPLIEWYSARKLLVTIDGEGDPESVYSLFEKAVDKFFGRA